MQVQVTGTGAGGSYNRHRTCACRALRFSSHVMRSSGESRYEREIRWYMSAISSLSDCSSVKVRR